MPRIPCRVLPLMDADGARQMALDHALLDSIDRDPSFAVFRTYTWCEPTLSLGYFQSVAMAEQDSRFAHAAIVRRLTGGGAIWHDRDLTYALIVPRSHLTAQRPSDLYRAVHRAIGDHLKTFGVSVQSRGQESGRPADRPLLCFLDHDSEDLVLDASKVVGSAQRRRPSAVLQHGSILLQRSPAVAELPGLRELTGLSMSPADLSHVSEDFFHSLGLEPAASTLSEEESSEADRLEAEVYRNPAWTRRR